MTKTGKMMARVLGMGEFVDRLNAGQCPFCGADMKQAQFKDAKAREEFRISGLCQACQDRTQADFEKLSRVLA